MSHSSLAPMFRDDFVRLAAARTVLAAARRAARAQQPKRGGVLRHVGFEPPTFDIHATVSYRTQLISSFVNRTLFKFFNVRTLAMRTDRPPFNDAQVRRALSVAIEA